MKLQINNYTYNSSEIATLFPPYKYHAAQKQAGVKVIKTAKQAWATLYNTQIKTLLIYDDPENSTLIRNITKFCLNNNIEVFLRNNCIPGISPTYTQYTKEHPIFNGDRYISSAFSTAPEITSDETLSDKDKQLLTKYLKYYDIDYPRSEPEWVQVKTIIDYYIEHEVPYAFDTNQYYICEECGDLVHHSAQHECYYDEPIKRTKLDYIVNGGE